MKHIIILYALIAVSASSFSQSEWDSWNQNYDEQNVMDLIQYEKIYADSVDQGLIEGKYYLRMDSYRFQAQYTGERRRIPDDIKSSMSRVFKVYGNPDYLPIIDDIKYEYQFAVDDTTYWISMQSILDKPFKEEIREGDLVYLYCLFLNEHGLDGKLYIAFLVSEFRK